MGTIHKLRKKWADSETIGLIVVVGMDTPENLDSMARKIGGDVYLDPEGKVMKNLGGKGVPHWWVLNSDNKILTHFGGYSKSVDLMIERFGL